MLRLTAICPEDPKSPEAVAVAQSVRAWSEKTAQGPIPVDEFPVTSTRGG